MKHIPKKIFSTNKISFHVVFIPDIIKCIYILNTLYAIKSSGIYIYT